MTATRHVRFYLRLVKGGVHKGLWMLASNVCLIGFYATFEEAVESGKEFWKKVNKARK